MIQYCLVSLKTASTCVCARPCLPVTCFFACFCEIYHAVPSALAHLFSLLPFGPSGHPVSTLLLLDVSYLLLLLGQKLPPISLLLTLNQKRRSPCWRIPIARLRSCTLPRLYHVELRRGRTDQRGSTWPGTGPPHQDPGCPDSSPRAGRG